MCLEQSYDRVCRGVRQVNDLHRTQPHAEQGESMLLTFQIAELSYRLGARVLERPVVA